MPRVIAFVSPAGVQIGTFVDDPGAQAQALAELRAQGHVPSDAVLIEVRESALPRSRRFRAAWRGQGDRVVVDLPQARAHRMAEIRAARDRTLAASDGLYLRAQDVGTPQDVAAWKTYRKALRDLPQTIDLDAVATPEALEAFEPAWPARPA